jgi:hypothetical protein
MQKKLTMSKRVATGDGRGKAGNGEWGGDRKSKNQETNLSLDISSAASLLNVGEVTVKHARAVLEKSSARTHPSSGAR